MAKHRGTYYDMEAARSEGEARVHATETFGTLDAAEAYARLTQRYGMEG